MTPLRTIIVILILLGLLLAAGCSGEVGKGKSVGNKISTVPVTSPTSIPVRNQSHPVDLFAHWIRIDPIGDKQVGDIFTITATTNLSAGEEILISVSPPFRNGPKVQTGEFNGVVGTIYVIRGNGGINTTSFVVNSSAFKPDEFIVSEDAIHQASSGAAIFNVNPKPVSSGNVTLIRKNIVDLEKLISPLTIFGTVAALIVCICALVLILIQKKNKKDRF